MDANQRTYYAYKGRPFKGAEHADYVFPVDDEEAAQAEYLESNGIITATPWQTFQTGNATGQYWIVSLGMQSGVAVQSSSCGTAPAAVVQALGSEQSPYMFRDNGSTQVYANAAGLFNRTVLDVETTIETPDRICAMLLASPEECVCREVFGKGFSLTLPRGTVVWSQGSELVRKSTSTIGPKTNAASATVFEPTPSSVYAGHHGATGSPMATVNVGGKPMLYAMPLMSHVRSMHGWSEGKMAMRVWVRIEVVSGDGTQAFAGEAFETGDPGHPYELLHPFEDKVVANFPEADFTRYTVAAALCPDLKQPIGLRATRMTERITPTEVQQWDLIGIKWGISRTQSKFYKLQKGSKTVNNVAERAALVPSSLGDAKALIAAGISPGDVYNAVLEKNATSLVIMTRFYSNGSCKGCSVPVDHPAVRLLPGTTTTAQWERDTARAWYRFYEMDGSLLPSSRTRDAALPILGYLDCPPHVKGGWMKVNALTRHTGLGALRKNDAFLNAPANLYPQHDEVYVSKIDVAAGCFEILAACNVLTHMRGLEDDAASWEQSVAVDDIDAVEPDGAPAAPTVAELYSPLCRPAVMDVTTMTGEIPFYKGILGDDELFDDLNKDIIVTTATIADDADDIGSLYSESLHALHGTVQPLRSTAVDAPIELKEVGAQSNCSYAIYSVLRTNACAKQNTTPFEEQIRTSFRLEPALDGVYDAIDSMNSVFSWQEQVGILDSNPYETPFRVLLVEAIVRLCVFSGVRLNYDEIALQLLPTGRMPNGVDLLRAYLPDALTPHAALVHTLGKPRAEALKQYLADAADGTVRSLAIPAHYGDKLRRHFFEAMLDSYISPVRVESAVVEARKEYVAARAAFKEAAGRFKVDTLDVFGPFVRYGYAKRALMRHEAERDTQVKVDNEMDCLIERLTDECPVYAFGCQLHRNWDSESEDDEGECPVHVAHDSVLMYMHRVLPRFAYPLVHQLAMVPHEHPDGLYSAALAFMFMCVHGKTKFRNSDFMANKLRYGCFMDTVEAVSRLYTGAEKPRGKWELAEGYGPRHMTFDDGADDTECQSDSDEDDDVLASVSIAESSTATDYKTIVENSLVGDHNISAHVFVVDGYEWSVPYSCRDMNAHDAIHEKQNTCKIQIKTSGSTDSIIRHIALERKSDDDTLLEVPAITLSEEGKLLVNGKKFGPRFTAVANGTDVSIDGYDGLKDAIKRRLKLALKGDAGVIENFATEEEAKNRAAYLTKNLPKLVQQQLAGDVIALYRLFVSGQLPSCVYNYRSEYTDEGTAEKITQVNIYHAVDSIMTAQLDIDETDHKKARFLVKYKTDAQPVHLDVRGGRGFIEVDDSGETHRVKLLGEKVFKTSKLSADELALVMYAQQTDSSQVTGVAHSDGRLWFPQPTVTFDDGAYVLVRGDSDSVAVVPNLDLPSGLFSALLL